MLTGLLYAAVIAMWAVVLVPRWLGSSDRYRETRSVQRFRVSLRSVTPRSPHRSHDVAADGDRGVGRVDTAPADGAIDDHLRLGIDPFVGTSEDARRKKAKAAERRRDAAAAAAQRRKRSLLILGGATVGSYLLFFLGMLSFFLPLVSTVALGGFVYLMRAQAQSRSGVQRHRADREALRKAATSAAEEPAHDTWQPVASPEPTYMRAPKATRFPRELDSTEQGAWTSARMWEQAEALRTAEDSEEELGLDEYAYPVGYPTARAVNE